MLRGTAKSSLLSQVQMLIVCAENIPHNSPTQPAPKLSEAMFTAWRLLAKRDSCYRDQVNLPHVQSYMITLPSCSYYAITLVPCSTIQNKTLSFQSSVAAPSNSPFHPISAFLCVCVLVISFSHCPVKSLPGDVRSTTHTRFSTSWISPFSFVGRTDEIVSERKAGASCSIVYGQNRI